MRWLIVLLVGCSPPVTAVQDAAVRNDAGVDARPDASRGAPADGGPCTANWCDGYHGVYIDGRCEDICSDFPYCPSGFHDVHHDHCGADLCTCAPD